jgi:hypothetical protein
MSTLTKKLLGAITVFVVIVIAATILGLIPLYITNGE